MSIDKLKIVLDKAEQEDNHPTMNDGFFFKYEVRDKSGSYKTVYAPDYDGLAKYLKEEGSLHTQGGCNYLWHQNKFDKIDDLVLKNYIRALIRVGQPPAMIHNFFQIAKIDCVRELPDVPAGKINLINGVLDVLTGKVYPHEPGYGFHYCLDHKFDPEADCPVFIKYLDYVTFGDKELQLLIQQMLGYIIMGGPPKAHKAFALYGDGNNGKSTLLYVIEALLGKNNISSIPMELFTKPFSTVHMVGKLANIAEETPKVINAEVFKNMVSGGKVVAAFKGKDEFTFNNTARLIFSCNELPQFGDASDGNRRRMIIVPFSRKIETPDVHIYQKLDKELSGILNFAIDGAKMLIQSDYRFLEAQKSMEALEEFKQETDSVHQFFREETEWTGKEDNFLSTNALFKSYKSWCEEVGNRAVRRKTFSNRANRYYEAIYKEKGLIFNKDSNDARDKVLKTRGVRRLICGLIAQYQI